ncbi:MAG: 30S ribosomal protein S3, partial [Acidimicrobiales bacterium]
SAGIPRIEIERTGEAVNVIVHTARPGVLVGRKGVRVDQLKDELQKITGMTCHLTVREIRRPELEATLVAEVVAEALEKRMAFRRAMKKAIQTTMQAGAKGVKIEINGRLGGAEMAREAKEREGQVPLSTLRANVDFGMARALTNYGVIGVKVWIYKGDILPYKAQVEEKIAREAAMAVGETSGQAPRVVSSAAARRRAAEAAEPEAAPLVKEADQELERLLAEEEDIERRIRQHHETPKFHGDSD